MNRQADFPQIHSLFVFGFRIFKSAHEWPVSIPNTAHGWTVSKICFFDELSTIWLHENLLYIL